MEKLSNIISSTNFGFAITGFIIFFVLSTLVARFGFRGNEKDRELSSEHNDEISENHQRWLIQWIRQDLSQLNGYMAVIAGLLGAILVVLIIK